MINQGKLAALVDIAADLILTLDRGNFAVAVPEALRPEIAETWRNIYGIW